MDYDQRDTRTRAAIEATLRDLNDKALACKAQAAELFYEATMYEREITDIRRACQAEQWYELSDILTPVDVESLCELSPINLLCGETIGGTS